MPATLDFAPPTDVSAEAAEAPAELASVNPKLSANLHADYEALQNDVHQAHELAAEFQRQLAGKSNEFASLKRLFEKTTSDLLQLQKGILELRKERHELANEAMRAVAFERRLGEATKERDRLRMEMEAMRSGLASSADEMARCLHERDVQIARLTCELETAREQFMELRPLAPGGSGTRFSSSEVKAVLGTLTNSFEQLKALLDPPAQNTKPRPAPLPPIAVEETIDITFAP